MHVSHCDCQPSLSLIHRYHSLTTRICCEIHQKWTTKTQFGAISERMPDLLGNVGCYEGGQLAQIDETGEEPRMYACSPFCKTLILKRTTLL